MSVPVLICTEGPRARDAWAITTQGLRIGRDPANEVHLEDTDVSRAHARVLLHNGAVWIQDAGSRNGVFVNDGRVIEHKQLSPGDLIAIGTHRFSVIVQEPIAEESVSVSLRSIQEPPKKKGWRIWPFVVALLVIGGCVGLIGSRGGGSTASVDETPPDPLSLQSLMTVPQPEKEAKGQEGDVSLKEALAMNAGTTEDGCAPSPAGMTSKALVEDGHSHYSAGRLRDAICSYRAALKIDPACEICVVRIERLEDELTEEIDRQFQAGLRYYDSLRYEQAINAWEMVLMLEPDEDAALHQRTKEYIEQAREKQEAQKR